MGRVLTPSSEISPGGWGRAGPEAGLTGQDRMEAVARGRGGGGPQMGSRWGVRGWQETDEAWTGRKRRTR